MAREIRNSEGTRLVDTVQFGLRVAENVLQANLGSEIGLNGNVQFVPAATVISAQIEAMMQENSVLRGVDTQDLPLSIYLGDRVPSSQKPGTKSILLDGAFFSPLLLIDPERESDKRGEFSDYCMILFDTVTLAVLDANAPEVELTRRQEVAEALFALHLGSLVYFQESNDPNPSIDRLIEAHREKFKTKEDEQGRAVVARGLKVSITEGDEKIITMNSVQDDDVRILILNDLRKKFAQSMKRRYFWFKPGMDTASPIDYPDDEDGVRVLELVQFAGCEGNIENLTKLYMSGELSVLFAELRIPPISEEEDNEVEEIPEGNEVISISSPTEGELVLGGEVELEGTGTNKNKPIVIKPRASSAPPRPDVKIVFGDSRELMGGNEAKKTKKHGGKRYYSENDEDDESF